VRRRDGSVSSLRELTTLQRWIVEGTLGRQDEVGLDGENWRPLGSIPDLEAFFLAADARAKVAALEEEVARLKLAAMPPAAEEKHPARTPADGISAPEAPRPPVPARPRPPMLTASSAAPASPPRPQEAVAPAAPAPATITPEEPAFTRTLAGLGLAPTDDWEPPKLHRGVGVRVVVLLAILLVAAALVGAYFYVWKPHTLRAFEEQARNSQLEREQADHEAGARAAEQRAKDELLQSLALAAGRDAGSGAAPDAGGSPRGSLEVPAPVPAPASVPTPTLVAAPGPAASAGGQQGDLSGAGDSPAAGPPTVPPLVRAPQTFDEWMAEADRQRTHERAAAALAAYDRALALKPSRSDAHAGRGLALLDLGRRTEALTQFQRALELDPRDGVAVLGLAEAYRSLGRSEEARRAYQRYLSGWPGGTEARAARAALDSLKE
jgi:tetratricopeptide (TPR) repeat protein